MNANEGHRSELVDPLLRYRHHTTLYLNRGSMISEHRHSFLLKCVQYSTLTTPAVTNEFAAAAFR